MSAPRFLPFLDRSVAIYPLITFRILFGAMMLFSTLRFIFLGWIEDHYIEPVFHFTYYGFGWVDALPSLGMYGVHAIMLLSALGILLGWHYRLSVILFFISFTYCELIDITYYLNHYYFVSLVSALLIFLPANRFLSVDSAHNPSITTTVVPFWTIGLIQFQLGLVYAYAGLAKINEDWLIHALPLKIWLPANDALPLIGPILTIPWLPYVFSWSGMLFDCTIVFFLLRQRTRPTAYVVLIFFHTVTGLLFQIGVFPLVMIASTLIFFSTAWHERRLTSLNNFMNRLVTASTFKSLKHSVPLHTSTLAKSLLLVYVVFQLAFPWRYLLYPGNLFWTEEGYRFSWRVMLMEKAGTALFFVRDQQTGREGVVDNREFLNAHQEKQMAMQPDMILQFAHFLKDEFERRGVQDPAVRAEVYVTLNSAPSKLLIDPNVNLVLLEDSWMPKTWLLNDE